MLVPRICGYYGRPIDSDRGIWQGDILSPDFFDIAVDAVFREWHRIADDITTGSTTTGKSYADDIRLGDTDQHRLQRNLDILLELFARLGLLPNAIKTKAMVSIGRSSGRMSDSAYKRRFNRSLPTYRARKRAKVECTYCHHAVNAQYLPTHLREIHHVLPPRELNEYTPSTCSYIRPHKRPHYNPVHEANAVPSFSCSDIVYRINLTDDPVPCPIHDCPAYLTTKYLTCIHFCTRHPEVGIEFSATDTLHRCSRCGLYLSSISATHHASDFCKRYARRRLALENERKQSEALNARFYVGDKELEIVRSYRYLGRIISDDDSDDLAVASQLQKARAVWSRLGALLRSDGAEPEVMGKFWKTITQAVHVLLFGSETWTISQQRSLRRLDRFQARCARYMARQHIRRFPDGSWDHPATAEVLDKYKMFTIDHYIKVRRCTLFKHYADEHSSLYGDCLGLEIDGRDHNLFWWNLEHS